MVETSHTIYKAPTTDSRVGLGSIWVIFDNLYTIYDEEDTFTSEEKWAEWVSYDDGTPIASVHSKGLLLW